MRTRREPVEIFAGRYEIEGVIGHGNRTVVDRAVDLVTGETVALKRWSGTLPPEERAAFDVDARTIAQAAGPGLVAYRSYGVADGAPFVAMELAAGGTLATRLARSRLSLLDALNTAKRLAWGLARLHNAGLAHRNVKPANVLLPEGASWQANLAEAWVETEELVRAGFAEGWFEGSVGYWSPQVFGGGVKTAGPRDDVYSLGVILFRCVAGCMPFPEHDNPSLANAVPASRTPRKLGQVVAGLPPDLVDLVDRMLLDDARERPKDAVEPCLALFALARKLGAYDAVTDMDLRPHVAHIPAHFEVREGAPVQAGPPPEPEIVVDPEALRGPYVLLDGSLERGPLRASPREIRLSPGAVFAGRFSIEEIAGAGSTGVVYKAKDIESRGDVALRIVDGAASEREIKRFLGDSAKHAQRYHPRIVRLLHRGVREGRMFRAMDWISGETLAARLSRQALTMREAVTVIRGLLEGLELVHTMGLVQGNLRPHNVFLRSRNVEWVKVGDPAVWRQASSAPDVPTPDLAYVAPEIARTGKPSARADLYALGVIAYRTLTGMLPFEAESREELAKARWAKAPSLAKVRPDAAPSLCRLVDELLEKDPSRRPHDAIVAAGWLNTKEDLG